MPHDQDNESFGVYASPPCFLHELDPSYAGLTITPPALPADEVGPWRKSERSRLISQRQAVGSQQRSKWDIDIAHALQGVLGDVRGAVISAYWPFRGEPDLRPLLGDVIAEGARVALPVVTEKKKPLTFRLWKPGDRLERGVWNIPYPAEGEIIRPNVVLAPVVGFDRAAYRLGYGGGFFDRTLAELGCSVRAIGIGYSQAELPTIHPQPHDIPMSLIVTESFIIKPSLGSLQSA
ncbi:MULTISPECIES: 5-formyltetrahydrofolate cyclo-ligase [unclassified Sinorhizobium]|uniref:5-formyltetrahydrofolate cyclo-ligase n=1 Tax=unclassified Sinorhizobium TaxID=2613772 RepID=UPI0035237B83